MAHGRLWVEAGVEVETSTDQRQFGEAWLVGDVLSRGVDPPFRFPLTTIVVRNQERIRVKGRLRTVLVYRCERAWITVLRCEERRITVRGLSIEPTDVRIDRLDDAGIATVLAAADG